MLERREPGDVPEAAPPDHVRGVAQQAIPGAALRREVLQRAVDLEGRRRLVEADGARAGRRDGRRAREERPAIGLQLELVLPPLEAVALQAKGAAGPAAAVIPGLEGVLRQVFLRHGLEPLRPRRAGHELAGDGERLVDRGAVLRRESDAEARPRLVVLAAGPRRANRLLERTDRLGASPLHPRGLAVADRDGQHRLGVAGSDLARPDRRPEERAQAQLAREPSHRLRRPLLDVQDLSRVVAQAREAETDEPVSDGEGGQAVPDLDLERPLDARHLGEQRLAGVGVGQTGVDQRSELRWGARLRRIRRRRAEARAGARERACDP